MSFASSHSESRLVEMSTHRSRVLSCPSGESRLSALIYVSEGAAPVDLGTVDALVAMRSNFDVDSIVMTRRLVEVRKNYFILLEFELHAPLPGEHPYDAFLNGFSLSTDALEAETPEHQVDALGSTTEVPSGKGKEPLAIEEALEQGYTLRELCEVEDRVGAERYLATVMTRLKGLHFITALIDRVHDAGQLVRSQHKRILALQAANKELKDRADQDLVAAAEAHVKELEGNVNKLRGEMKPLKTQRRRLEEEVGILRSSSDEAQNDRARLEGDVLSLTEATTLLEAKLKNEGVKAVVAYKASRGFESGLEKMG
ncbi:hypothetical protein B296_00013983 [Ensete ventricosum]|uniref:Uncharacterized protein n=1 Tax=Ensete ventricosum TaxID=4639 RepID=A0A426Y4F6_ENSVE|nr:hypothetical protein B296_00013983 [Ensete ventricosum]